MQYLCLFVTKQGANEAYLFVHCHEQPDYPTRLRTKVGVMHHSVPCQWETARPSGFSRTPEEAPGPREVRPPSARRPCFLKRCKDRLSRL